MAAPEGTVLSEKSYHNRQYGCSHPYNISEVSQLPAIGSGWLPGLVKDGGLLAHGFGR